MFALKFQQDYCLLSQGCGVYSKEENPVVKLLLTSVKTGYHPRHLDAQAPVDPMGIRMTCWFLLAIYLALNIFTKIKQLPRPQN